MSKEEAIIRERRTLEATKKNLVGPAGKFGIIARYLGTPIRRQGGIDNFISFDVYADVEEEAIPTAEEHDFYDEGWYFDGLSRGIHLEIKYYDPQKKLSVSYKGYSVYEEIAGDLNCYAPFPEWEDCIERLYKAAKIKEQEFKVEKQAEDLGKAAKKQQTFLQKLRYKWGI